MNDPNDRPGGKDPSRKVDGADERRGRLARAAASYARTRTRLDTTAAGHVQRRVAELELMNQALILAALGLMLFIPGLISLAAFSPIGSDGGLAADWARRLGLSAQASHDLRSLFASRKTISGATTPVSAVISFLFAFAWPAALQRGYEIMWGVPSRGRRDLWRPILWLVTFLGVIAAVASTGALVGGVIGNIVTGVICFPLVFAWCWWMQHLLLGGRVGWRPLLGGAVSLALALFGLSVFMALFMSESITSHYRQYGPIGVVFVLLSWFIALAVVMLGGALVGATLYQRRTAGAPAFPPYPAAGGTPESGSARGKPAADQRKPE
ncbi:MAG: hypothetical protein ACQSGP_02305 [Frankia sp.]